MERNDIVPRRPQCSHGWLGKTWIVVDKTIQAGITLPLPASCRKSKKRCHSDTSQSREHRSDQENPLARLVSFFVARVACRTCHGSKKGGSFGRRPMPS